MATKYQRQKTNKVRADAFAGKSKVNLSSTKSETMHNMYKRYEEATATLKAMQRDSSVTAKELKRMTDIVKDYEQTFALEGSRDEKYSLEALKKQYGGR